MTRLCCASAAVALFCAGAESADATWTGAGAPDASLTRQGRPTRRWALADGDFVQWSQPCPQAAQRSGLHFWVHSVRPTGARLTLRVLAPDQDNAYTVQCSVDWRGWNHVQLEKGSLRPAGQPAWARVAGIRLDGQEGFVPPTVLHLGPFEWTDESPRWDIGGEWLIGCLYNSTFSQARSWKVQEHEDQLGSAHVLRYWNALRVCRKRQGPAPGAVAVWRRLNVDISDCQALRVQASLPRDASLGLRARIDGKAVTLAKPDYGRDNWFEYRAPIAGRRLEALYLDCGDSEFLRPQSRRSLEYNLHFITLEKKGFTPPTFPKQPVRRDLPETFAVREPLLDAGLPAWLYFGREDVPGLRQKVASGVPASIFASIKRQADSCLGYDPTPYVHDYYPTKSHAWLRSWTPTQPWTRMMDACAFAYVITGEPRYAAQAKRLLMAMANTTHWNYGMVSRYPKGWRGHGGPFCEASCGARAALAYNWLYSVLSDDERRQVEEAILWKGWFWLHDYVLTRSYIRAMNQGPWFNYGALVHAMAVEHRYPWLRQSYGTYEANINESVGLCYYQDGANTEGAGYWAATTNYVVSALPLLARVMGKDIKTYVPEPLAKSIELPIYMRSMASKDWCVLGVNDGNYSRWSPGHIALFFASLLELPQAQWAWQEAAAKPNYHRDPILSIIWHRDWGETPRPELSLAKRFRGVDWAFLRSGWDYGDVFFALQSGRWGRGHQHADKNSFVLEAYGERLCPDKGITAYGSPRGLLYQSTVSHNTITINAGNQRRANAKITRFEHNDRFDLVESDATANYAHARKVLRRILFVRPRYFVIADEVVLDRPGVVEFNLHTFSQVRVDGDALLFTGDKADMLLKIVAPSAFGHRFTQTLRTPRSQPVHDVQLFTPAAATEAVYLTVLYPVPKGQPLPAVAYERTETGAVIRVTHDHRTDTIVWREREGFDVAGLAH